MFVFLILPLLNDDDLPAKILILRGFCKYFLRNLLLFYFYFTSTLPLLNLYHISTKRIRLLFLCNKRHLFINKWHLSCNNGLLFIES